MKRFSMTCGALALTLALGLAMSVAQAADTMIADFQSGLGPIIVQGGVTGLVGPDTEPDFDGDQSLLVYDADGGFQNAISFSGVPYLLDLHAHSTIEFEADSVAWGDGGYLNSHIVFNSNNPDVVSQFGNGFQVLTDSSSGANGGSGWAQTNDDQLFSYNYESGQGRDYLNLIDANHDGVLDGGSYFQVYVVQQGGASTTLRYDDIRLTGVATVPEPASTSLLVLGSLLAGTLSGFGRSRRS